MNIKGHGVDIVETARIRRMLGDHPERFLKRVFTADERAYAESRPKRTDEHLAGRFASKEAVLKVLGTGWSGGIAWTGRGGGPGGVGAADGAAARGGGGQGGGAGDHRVVAEHLAHRHPRGGERDRGGGLNRGAAGR